MVFLRACGCGLHLDLSGPDSPRVTSEAWFMIAMWQYGFRVILYCIFVRCTWSGRIMGLEPCLRFRRRVSGPSHAFGA